MRYQGGTSNSESTGQSPISGTPSSKENILRIIRPVLAALLIVAFHAADSICEDTIRIGAILSTSGPAATAGISQKNSLIMLQDRVNGRGGILGKQIEILVANDETDVSLCSFLAERLIEDEDVVAVIGPTTSGNTIFLADRFKRARIPLLSLAQSDALVNPVRRWIFKAAPSISHAVERDLDHARDMGIETVAIITSLDGFGREGRAAIISMAPKKGIKVIADEVFRPVETDLTANLTRILNLDPDAVICWGNGPGEAAILRNRLQLDMDSPFYHSHLSGFGKFIRYARKASEEIYLPAGRLLLYDQLPEDDIHKGDVIAYVEEYRSRYNISPSPYGGIAWDALSLVLAAIEAGGSYDPPDIRDNLERISGFVGLTGIYDLSPRDHNGLDENAFIMTEIIKGKLKITD